jgi:hypothetical protein
MGRRTKAQKKKLSGKALSKQEQAQASKPRNELVRQIVEQGGIGGAGKHRDRRYEAKNGGRQKHKGKGYDEY